MAALRGVEQALHEHRDSLRRAAHFATLGRLAAGLSHEIRNPLGALFLHIDLLEEEFRGFCRKFSFAAHVEYDLAFS